MKRSFLVLVTFLLTFFAISPLSLGAVDLRSLDDDFSTFFEATGRELLPHLQQTGTGGAGIGAATIPGDRRFFFAMSMGAVLSDGFKGSVEAVSYDLLNVPNLMTSLLGLSGAAERLYGEIFPYPLLRLSAGFTLPAEIELITQFAIVPQGLTDAIAARANLTGIRAGMLNAGFRARRPLLSESGPMPGVSVGLGYSYSGLNLGYALPDDFSQEFDGAVLAMEGTVEADADVHTMGLDMVVSRELAFFVPFLRLSPYYQASSFTGTVKGFDAEIGTDVYSEQTDETPEGTVSSHDFAVDAALGFELDFGGYVLLAEAGYSTASAALGAELAMRFQF